MTDTKILLRLAQIERRCARLEDVLFQRLAAEDRADEFPDLDDVSGQCAPAPLAFSSTQDRVLTAIKALGGEAGKRKIVEITGLHPTSVQWSIRELLSSGLVVRIDDSYCVADRAVA
jgi:hypothetical protein